MPDRDEYFPFNLPQYKNPRIDLWKHIDANNLNALLSCFQPVDSGKSAAAAELGRSISPLSDKRPKTKSPSRRAQSLLDHDQYKLFAGLVSKLFSLKAANKRDQILVDNYYYLFKFAIAQDFSAVQISSLLSLMIRTHELAMETAFGNLDETFDCFRKILLGYSVHRPPFSLAIFTAKEAEKIVAYFFNTYFKQFKLFKYIYTPAVALNLQFKYTNLPPPPPPAVDLTGVDAAKSESADELADSAASTTVNGQLVDSASNVAGRDELREFIRQYLNQRVDKMKSELDDELKKTATELGIAKPAPANAKRQPSSGKRTK